MVKNIVLGISLSIITVACCEQPKGEYMESKVQKNATVETIMNRRSIRSYKPNQIKQEQLDTIIECGINAPSALNKQTWEIRVIQKPELLKAINDGFVKFAADKQMQGSASKAQQPGFSIFHGAPTLIIVAGNKNEWYNMMDCGLLGQNMVLAAESMDIGSCILGSVVAYLATLEAQAEIIPQLNLPADYQLNYAIALGYKNEHPKAKPRDKSKVQYIR